jgi:hypothetical protein
MRRAFATALASLLLAAVLATVFVAGVAVAPDVAAIEECDVVVRPSDEITVRSGAQEVMLAFDLGANTASSVQAQQGVTLFQLTSRGFSGEAIQEVSEYFASLLSWYDFLAHPCAEALPYTGPFTNVPEMASAPFGFGGIDAMPGPAFVMRFSRSGDEPGHDAAEDAVVPVVSAFADRPALAHSGGESAVLAYFGAGLLAFGATALGMRRWMSGPFERSCR